MTNYVIDILTETGIQSFNVEADNEFEAYAKGESEFNNQSNSNDLTIISISATKR